MQDIEEEGEDKEVELDIILSDEELDSDQDWAADDIKYLVQILGGMWNIKQAYSEKIRMFYNTEEESWCWHYSSYTFLHWI